MKKREAINDSPSIIMGLIGLFVWWLGLVLYFVLKKSSPKKANSAIIGTLIGLVISLVVLVIKQVS